MARKPVPPTTTPSSQEMDSIRSISLPGEHWKQARGHGLNYFVSNMGRLLTTRQYGARIVAVMTPALDPAGYYRTMMDGHTVKVHRIVAENWLENPLGLPYINHIDCNPTNNRAENLEWCTPKYNAWYGATHGNIKLCRHPRQDILTQEEREEIHRRFVEKTGGGKVKHQRGKHNREEILLQIQLEYPPARKVHLASIQRFAYGLYSRSKPQPLITPSEREKHHTHIVSDANIVI